PVKRAMNKEQRSARAVGPGAAGERWRRPGGHQLKGNDDCHCDDKHADRYQRDAFPRQPPQHLTPRGAFTLGLVDFFERLLGFGQLLVGGDVIGHSRRQFLGPRTRLFYAVFGDFGRLSHTFAPCFGVAGVDGAAESPDEAAHRRADQRASHTQRRQHHGGGHRAESTADRLRAADTQPTLLFSRFFLRHTTSSCRRRRPTKNFRQVSVRGSRARLVYSVTFDHVPMAVRPSNARPRVTSSAYSRSPPTGNPLASFETRTPNGSSVRIKYVAVASPSRLGSVAIMTSVIVPSDSRCNNSRMRS